MSAMPDTAPIETRASFKRICLTGTRKIDAPHARKKIFALKLTSEYGPLCWSLAWRCRAMPGAAAGHLYPSSENS
ncbi:hypothetical protein [Paraburkholderia bryophila]|uniref:hypothetical protein n=1 Tax=Paraburkholderia bryophila TaxID=420952 RepID=UPI0011BEB6BD|nr:hypothetical protein [Paraburkholderia bryophila]